MCKRPVRNRDHALQANDRGLRIDPYGLGSSKCVSWRETRRRRATRARECGERAARAQGVVMGRRDARMDGEDAGRRIPRASQPAGQGEPQGSTSSGRDWSNSKSGTGSGSAKSRVGV